MITKKKWKKQYLKAVLREEIQVGSKAKWFVNEMAKDFYGVLTPGELIEDYREAFEDGLIPIYI